MVDDNKNKYEGVNDDGEVGPSCKERRRYM